MSQPSGDKANTAASADRKLEPKEAVLAVQAFTVLLGTVFIVSVIGLWDVATTTSYPLRQSIEWNWRARATNDLVDMAANLNRSIELLMPFHGNPAWIFPTPDTDLDEIRLSLVQMRDTALAVAANASIGSFGYQQAVQNLQETIIEINDHLSLTKGWFVRTPAAVALFLAYLAFTVIGALCVAGGRVVDKVAIRRPGIVFGLVWFLGSVVTGFLLAIVP